MRPKRDFNPLAGRRHPRLRLLGARPRLPHRPRSLLAGADSARHERDSVWAQLYQAKDVDTEAAWLAVIDYFPDASPYYHNLAKQGLVYYYFHAQEYDKAIKPLEELAAQPDFQAFGIAGLVVAYANLDDDEQAYIENQRLSTDMRVALEKQSPTMAELLNECARRISRPRSVADWPAVAEFRSSTWLLSQSPGPEFGQ